jgi:hypothetical protein
MNTGFVQNAVISLPLRSDSISVCGAEPGWYEYASSALSPSCIRMGGSATIVEAGMDSRELSTDSINAL